MFTSFGIWFCIWCEVDGGQNMHCFYGAPLALSHSLSPCTPSVAAFSIGPFACSRTSCSIDPLSTDPFVSSFFVQHNSIWSFTIRFDIWWGKSVRSAELFSTTLLDCVKILIENSFLLTHFMNKLKMVWNQHTDY